MLGPDISMYTHHTTLKQTIGSLQEELLLLFIKYKLAFRFHSQAIDNLPLPIQAFRKILIHCFSHAVFDNARKGYPELEINVYREQEYFKLDIYTSGSADSFATAVHEYCQDLYLQDYLQHNAVDAILPILQQKPCSIYAGDREEGGCQISFILQG